MKWKQLLKNGKPILSFRPTKRGTRSICFTISCLRPEDSRKRREGFTKAFLAFLLISPFLLQKYHLEDKLKCTVGKTVFFPVSSSAFSHPKRAHKMHAPESSDWTRNPSWKSFRLSNNACEWFHTTLSLVDRACLPIPKGKENKSGLLPVSNELGTPPNRYDVHRMFLLECIHPTGKQEEGKFCWPPLFSFNTLCIWT